MTELNNDTDPPSKKIRILSADDHPLFRQGIASLIEQHRDFTLVGEAENGVDAVESFRKVRPDVTLMDIQMPAMDGIDATLEIRKEFPDARIIVLTTYEGDVRALRAIKAGASGYLLKSMLATDLLETVRIVNNGHRQIPPHISTNLLFRKDPAPLSGREIEVLEHVATGKSNKRIAASMSLTEDTIKAHVKNILSKLDAYDRTHAVVIAIGTGIIDIK